MRVLAARGTGRSKARRVEGNRSAADRSARCLRERECGQRRAWLQGEGVDAPGSQRCQVLGGGAVKHGRSGRLEGVVGQLFSPAFGARIQQSTLSPA